ncbi:MAG TPA: fumarylacetoacetate hydrolase family protein [Bacillota bacterium]
MRWVRFATGDGQPRLGALTAEGVHDLAAVAAGLPEDCRAAVERGDMVQWIALAHRWREAVGAVFGRVPVRPLQQVRLLAPIPRPPKNIFCVGRNYRAHVQESSAFFGGSADLPACPVFFTKAYTCIVGPGDDVRFDPEVTRQVDYEGELAVVIGRRGSGIPRERAWDHVFGFTLMNDVSARDLQHRHHQFFKGKSLDTFAPLGPAIVDRADVPDLAAVRLETYVNGELRQQASPSALIFDIPTLIHELSRGLTLEPGDIIATGTPDGVGLGFDPPRFLSDGDVVEVRMEPIGTLRNTVRSTREAGAS